jgi:hypothetical protein
VQLHCGSIRGAGVVTVGCLLWERELFVLPRRNPQGDLALASGKQTCRFALVIAVSMLCSATLANASEQACSVDAVAADGESVHFDYVTDARAPGRRLLWSIKGNSSWSNVVVNYNYTSDIDTGNVVGLNISGHIKLDKETASKSAILMIAHLDGHGYKGRAFLNKNGSSFSRYGFVTVSNFLAPSSMAGQWLLQAINDSAQLRITVTGDTGDTLGEDFYDFGAAKDKDALISKARKQMASAISDGCQPLTPLFIKPVQMPKQ